MHVDFIENAIFAGEEKPKVDYTETNHTERNHTEINHTEINRTETDHTENSAIPHVFSTDTGRNSISDETIEYVGILAKLELSEAEKEQAKKDMERMLDYIDVLNELDTTGVEPLSQVFPISNVFREDVVENGDNHEDILKNAPAGKNGSFKVPRTIE